MGVSIKDKNTNVEIEAGYVNTDEHDVMQMHEIGEEIPGTNEEEIMMNQIRKAVVSKSSINSYCTYNAAFLGYFIDLHYNDTYNGPDFITQQWLDILAPFWPALN